MLLPSMLGAATALRSEIDGLQCVLPVAPALRGHVAEMGRGLPDLAGVHLVHGDTYNAIRCCDVVIAAAGTVTLEAAILGTPLIATYRMSNMTYRIVRRLVRVRYGALPNLLADREIVPELLQEAATAENMADAARRLLTDASARERQKAEVRSVVALLGEGGAVARAASVVLEASGQ